MNEFNLFLGRKLKINFGPEKTDRMICFSEQKAQALQAQTDRTDKEIDRPAKAG